MRAVLTALAAAFARAGHPLRARQIAGAIGSEDSDGSYESSASLKVVQGLVRAGLLDAARDAATDNRYESRVQGLALVVDALSLRNGLDTVTTPARRAVADASGLTEDPDRQPCTRRWRDSWRSEGIARMPSACSIVRRPKSPRHRLAAWCWA